MEAPFGMVTPAEQKPPIYKYKVANQYRSSYTSIGEFASQERLQHSREQVGQPEAEYYGQQDSYKFELRHFSTISNELINNWTD